MADCQLDGWSLTREPRALLPDLRSLLATLVKAVGLGVGRGPGVGLKSGLTLAMCQSAPGEGAEERGRVPVKGRSRRQGQESQEVTDARHRAQSRGGSDHQLMVWPG